MAGATQPGKKLRVKCSCGQEIIADASVHKAVRCPKCQRALRLSPPASEARQRNVLEELASFENDAPTAP